MILAYENNMKNNFKQEKRKYFKFLKNIISTVFLNTFKIY